MNLNEEDARWVWHPYTQHRLGESPLPVRRASGAYLELEDGRRLLDGISSWWVNIHGHGHPAIAQAIARQAKELDHVLFAGCTHAPGVEVCKRLVTAAQAAGAPVSRGFFSDNGSTAVEVALKLCLQFQQLSGHGNRRKILALRGSYHGDTFGSMSVSEPAGFHQAFRDLLLPVEFVEPGDLEGLTRKLEDSGRELAAFIFEPLLQGAGGMRIHSPEYLRAAAELCRSAGLLLIADEVFTGFHRTGPCFAFQGAGIAPDLICLSKGLTGGTLPLALTLCREALFEAFLAPDLSSAFLHGHSYTANPIACAAALASWELLQSDSCQSRISRIADRTSRRIAELKDRREILDARSIGTIGAIQIRNGSEIPRYFSKLGKTLRAEAQKRGVLLRPLGDVLYTVPPYCVEDDELDLIYQVMGELAAQTFSLDTCLN